MPSLRMYCINLHLYTLSLSIFLVCPCACLPYLDLMHFPYMVLLRALSLPPSLSLILSFFRSFFCWCIILLLLPTNFVVEMQSQHKEVHCSAISFIFLNDLFVFYVLRASFNASFVCSSSKLPPPYWYCICTYITFYNVYVAVKNSLCFSPTLLSVATAVQLMSHTVCLFYILLLFLFLFTYARPPPKIQQNISCRVRLMANTTQLKKKKRYIFQK
jgi:hypothetical protein